jgi:hypothetical protein
MPIRVLACVVGFLCAAAIAAPSDAQWRRLDTPNFIVIGDVPARDLRAAGARFEGFREALGSILNDRLTTSLVPTVVVVFSSDGAFTPFKPRFQGRRVDVDGVFLQGRHVNYIAIVNGRDDEPQRVIMHEFAHLLVANTGLEVPLWLHEGLAEYYSTLVLSETGEAALVGRFIQDHLNRLNRTKLLTLAEMLGVGPGSPLYNEDSRRSVFYAQSWALAHMLMNGEPRRGKELGQYLEHLSSGRPAAEAWTAAFGTADIMAELERYIRRLQFTAFAFKLSGKVASLEDTPAVDLPRTDSDAWLGHLLVQLDAFDDAAARFASVEKRDPSNVRARIGLALLEQRREQFTASAARLAGLAPPEDWLLAYLAGQAMGELVTHALLPPTAQTSAAIRAMFMPAMQAGREFPAIAATLTQVEMSGISMPSADTRAALDRARKAAPGYAELHLIHAQVLARAGDFAGARDVLAPLMTPGHPPAVRDMARQIMGRIAERQARPAGPGVNLRIPFKDEQRTEGALHAIVCAAGKDVLFQLMLPGADGKPGAAATFTAAKLDDVQFLTNRTDLTSPVGCGPLTETMPVRVIWRPGGNDTRRVLVIEFLPKKVD